MAKKPELDQFHYHEMLDRLYVVTEMIDTHVQQHPVAKIETTIGMLISDANDKLTTAYQLTGQIKNNKTNKTNKNN